MNDMRLPGIGPFSADTLASGASDATRDPAQAFDAVMSRFAGERPRSNAPAPQDKKSNEARAPQGPKAKPADQARPADKGTQGNKADDTSAAGSANGKPVDRSKAATTDEEGDPKSSESAATGAPGATDPAVLAALAAAAAGQLTNPATQIANAAGATTEAKQHAAGQDAAANGDATRSPLDVFAVQVNAGAVRNGDKPGADPRVAVGDETEGVVVAPNLGRNRAPAGTKDTLRIDAPLMRAMEAVQGELAARATGGSNAAARGATALTAAAQEASPQMLAAAIAAATQTPGTTATYSIAHAAVGAPVGSPAFADELSQRVVMFAGQKVQRADIAVTPVDLGPIAVSIEVRGQEATLAFAAASHATRSAIEDALPKLRDMLAAQGLHLAGTHVGSEPRRDSGYRPSQGNSGGSNSRRSNDAVGAVGAAVATDTPVVQRRVNLIDIEV